MSLLKKWKNIAEKIGNFQARLILTVLYFVVFIFPSIIAKLSVTKQEKSETNWTVRKSKDLTFEDVRKQW